MPEVETVRTRQDLDEFLSHASPDRLTAEQYHTHAPQESLIARGPSGSVEGRCSLWWDATPSLDGQQVGLIGHYAAQDAAAAHVLLRHAVTRLGSRRRIIMGPMDGSTWRRYRVVTKPGTEPPFFLEPTNPPSWPEHFAASGFIPAATYVSSLVPRDAPSDPKAAKARERLHTAGITLRPVDLGDFKNELQRIHHLSLASFQSNFLYTPISEREFLDQYLPVGPLLDPRLVWAAELGNEVVGFSFALPDLLQRERGQKVDTAIFKTLAVRPDLGGEGLGGVLTAHTLQACWDARYQRVIGALMHVDNRSRRISDKYGDVMREYALYQARTAA